MSGSASGPTDPKDSDEPSHPSLSEIGRRIDEMERRPSVVGPAVKARSAGESSALGRAFRLSTEFVAAVAVGGGMGYLADRWLGTGPFLFLAFFVLGVGAGFISVLRAARAINAQSAELAKDATPVSGCDDEANDVADDGHGHR